MKILFDQGTPVPLRRHLHPHEIDTAAEQGWSELRNGDLLDRAEENGYEAFITTDQNLKCQQNVARRRIRILVLTTTSWPRISKKPRQIRAALEGMNEGAFSEVDI